MTESSKSVLAFNLSYLFDRDDLMQEGMADLLRWLDERTIVPPPVTTYPLAEVARAHKDLESGATVGKLVLVP
jgi:NADPH:quinone reductase-like Zn-dependent oxidoreductase